MSPWALPKFPLNNDHFIKLLVSDLEVELLQQDS